MTTTINASVASGIVATGDTSGVLGLQANGTTIATISSTGVAVTGSVTTNGVVGSPYTMKNRIINGNMVIDQRYAGTATANTISNFVVDRWWVGQIGTTGKIIAQQNAGSVTPPAGFSNYLGITSQSAYSVGAAQEYTVQQPIEGYNIADLSFGTASAKSVTLSFWVRSSLTGTFAISLRNATTNRSYVSTYTISSANTWEQKTITVAGDTSGTWLTTNGAGIYLDFDLGSGSSLSTTANTWTTGNYTTTSGVTNVVGTNGATWYVTGVQLEAGSSATQFEWRPYGMELSLCQRYYAVFGGDTSSADTYQAFTIGLAYSATLVRGVFNLPVNMRTAPSVTSSGSLRCFDGTTSSAGTSIAIDNNNLKTPLVQLTTSSMTTGRAIVMSQSADNTAKVMFSAEL